jgi:hypothetical protein
VRVEGRIFDVDLAPSIDAIIKYVFSGFRWRGNNKEVARK